MSNSADRSSASRASPLPGITGLRFIAACMVLFAHGTLFTTQFQDSARWSAFWSCMGSMAMTLFFVLSGFVIHYNYCDLFKTKPTSSALWTFFSARIARLYPMYVCCFLLYLASVPIAASFPDKLHIAPLQLTFTQSWLYLAAGENQTATNIFFAHSWPISTEFGFYLLFPFIVRPIGLMRRRSIVSVALCITVVASLYMSYWMATHPDDLIHLCTRVIGGDAKTHSYFPGWLGYFFPLTRFPEFCTGCLAAQLFRTVQDRSKGKRETAIGCFCILISLLVVAGFIRQFTGESSISVLRKMSVNYLLAPAYATIIFCTARYPSILTRWLDRPFVVLLGESSYSIYLLHMSLLTVFVYPSIRPMNSSTLVEWAFRMTSYACLTVIVSIGTYRFVEVPGRRWLRERLASLPRLTVRPSRRILVPLIVYGLPLVGMGTAIAAFYRWQLPATYSKRGMAHHTAGDLAAAESDFSLAIRIDARNPEIWFRRGLIRYAKGDYQGAKEDYCRAISLNHLYDEALNHLAMTRAQLGDFTGSIADVTSALRIKPSPATYQLRASFYRHLGRIDEALADNATALTLNPNEASYVVMRGDLYLSKGDRLGALAEFSRALDIDPRHEAALSARARIREEGNDLSGSLADYERLLEKLPGNSEVWNRRYLVSVRLKQSLANDRSSAPLDGEASADRSPGAEREVDYNRDILPILRENCFGCHGPDAASRRAGIRLDLREKALDSKAIVPGKPDLSAAILRIFQTDESKIMPPKSHRALTAAEKDALKKWIADGAEYQKHWSFVPPRRPVLPLVRNVAWLRNPIDSFVLAELEKQGLPPAPMADRRSLARRLSLDLIGLPPTAAEVEAFANDPSIDYYEKYVERLLQSPHWGEHRGRYWLDLARYGDSHGLHIDNLREIWSYRDSVIRAFNRNQRFDEFSIEQLAGDLIPNGTFEQRVASGFNRCNVTSGEPGAIEEEYAVLATRDRTETTATVWLGLTANCAVCHDHKFDPLSQREFYRMAAFFNNAKVQTFDANLPHIEPVATIPCPADRARCVGLNEEIAATQGQFDTFKRSARTDFNRWQKEARSKYPSKLSSAVYRSLFFGIAESRIADLLMKPEEKRTPEEIEELFDLWLSAKDERFAATSGRLRTRRQEEAAMRSRGTVAHVMVEKSEPPSAFVLFRGAYDQRREKVAPGTPRFLPPLPEAFPRNRLGFARWLFIPEQPLTARVAVNRFWQEVFGTGLVRSSNDFGTTGELPSHPELLDWLAIEFRESQWNVKNLFRLIVASAAYRQAAVTTAEKFDSDPDNRLLSRGSRFRMDAEMVRDYALATSGLLVRTIGGASVKSYQPEGIWEAVYPTSEYHRDSGEKLYRRSVYSYWKRSAPPAVLEILNAPNRRTCTVCRERTNTPLQALATLNDTQFVEAARVLAQVALREADGTDRARFDFLAKRLLARSMQSEELEIAARTYEKLMGFYRTHPDEVRMLLSVGDSKADPSLDPAALAAWTMVVNYMMNLDEVLNK